MQRVLSFPSARPNEDTSDFITKRLCFSFVLSVGFLALLAGFLLGRFSFDQELALSRANLRAATQHIRTTNDRSSIFKEKLFFNAENQILSMHNINQLLIQLNSIADEGKLVEYIHRKFQEYKCEYLTPIQARQVHVSYPLKDKINFRNQITILNKTGHEIETFESIFDDSLDNRAKYESFLCSATVIGEPVYVNFGREEDYTYLESVVGIDVAKRVVLLRVSKNYNLEEIVSAAFDRDAAAVLLFVETQQNALLNRYNTARIHSLATHCNRTENTVVMELSSQNVEKLFKLMEHGGQEMSPSNWRGQLHSNYPIYGSSDLKLRIHLHLLNSIETNYDVVAAFRGIVEPDNYIVLSSTSKQNIAYLLEMTRIIGQLKPSEFQFPYRSIIFAPSLVDNRPEDGFGFSKLLTKLNHRGISGLINLNVGVHYKSQFSYSLVFDGLLKQFLNKTNENFMDESVEPFVEAGIPYFQIYTNRSVDNEIEARFILNTIISVVKSAQLPYTLQRYKEFFNNSIAVVKERFQLIARKHALFLDSLEESVQLLINEIEQFEKGNKSNGEFNEHVLRFVHALSCKVNDRPKIRQQNSHIIFSRAQNNEPVGFGTLQRLLREMTYANANPDLHSRILTILMDLVQCFNSAKYAFRYSLDNFFHTYNNITSNTHQN